MSCSVVSPKCCWGSCPSTVDKFVWTKASRNPDQGAFSFWVENILILGGLCWKWMKLTRNRSNWSWQEVGVVSWPSWEAWGDKSLAESFEKSIVKKRGQWAHVGLVLCLLCGNIWPWHFRKVFIRVLNKVFFLSALCFLESQDSEWTTNAGVLWDGPLTHFLFWGLAVE